MFIVDMSLPGIEIRPLRQMTGVSRFSEVFFDGCRLESGAVLGEVGQGWRTAITTLMNERVSIGTSNPAGYGHPASALAAEARRRGLIEDPVIVDRICRLAIRERITGLLGKRVTEALLAGAEPGAGGLPGQAERHPGLQGLGRTGHGDCGARPPRPGPKTVGWPRPGPRSSAQLLASPSRAAPTRSCATSWPSGSWGCRGNLEYPPATRTEGADDIDDGRGSRGCGP